MNNQGFMTQSDVLTVSSEKQYSKEEKNRHFVRQEFGYAAFSRSFAIPEDVDPDKVKAKLDDGILRISIPTSHTMDKNVKLINVK